MNIEFYHLKEVLESILCQKGMTLKRSAKCATIFAESTLDGVHSHGINRFPSFVQQIESKVIDIHASPNLDKKLGGLEQWDGQLGPGPLNASFAMGRAITLAQDAGIACVAMRNTNHWMRGGTYGIQAAEAGMIGICWTNTKPNMPVWGGSEPRIGNNPFVISAPGPEYPILLDMSMSLFSYGKMEQYDKKQAKLPFPGGFTEKGELTSDPQVILNNELALPMGNWKGAGLSIMLDLLSTLLSKGKSTHKIGMEQEEYGVSQIFIAINAGNGNEVLVQEILDSITESPMFNPKQNGRYPGMNTLEIRKKQLQEGIYVHEKVWEEIVSLSLPDDLKLHS